MSSRFCSTISESDSKILNQLFVPYQWFTPSVASIPKFENLPYLFGSSGAQQGIQQQVPSQQFQQPIQQGQDLGQQMLQQSQQPIQQGLQQQMQQQGIQQPLQQQQLQQPLQQQQLQQPLQQDLGQQIQQPIQQFQQPLQQQVQQPLQQSFGQQFQQPIQQQYQQPLQQQMQQPIQQQSLQPSDAAFQQGVSTFIDQGPQQFGKFKFEEIPLPTVFVDISELEGLSGRGGYQGEKIRHKGKRIPIVDQTELPHQVNLMQGSFSDWQMEARNCIDKILQLNNKAYNRVHLLENFKIAEGGMNYQNSVENWCYRLRRNLDNLVKENERLRAELESGSFGQVQGIQGNVSSGIQGGVNQGIAQGGVNMGQSIVSDVIDSTPVIRPSEIKKFHTSTEKIGEWHPQKQLSFAEKVKDTAVGIATSVENVALHPIQSVGKLASTVEQVALHPIQSVENAADAVVHTVM